MKTMREIKFRAWDKRDKRWFDGYNNILYLFSQDTGGWGKTETDKFSYSQSTGLHDKNGKEIYEGDIVRFWSNDNLCVIRWEEVRAGFETRGGHVTKGDMAKSEVIGNVWENPGLLKGNDTK